jgi:hypothetical protein
MGTRSTIALEYADGTVGQVYCHWDGYLENNGMILYKHYSDPFKLRDLMDIGDLSSLGERIGTQHAFDRAPEGECTFYKRDRKENGVSQKMFANFEDYLANHQYEEYEYILRNDNGVAVWYVADHGDRYVSLADALAEHLREKAEEETLQA